MMTSSLRARGFSERGRHVNKLIANSVRYWEADSHVRVLRLIVSCLATKQKNTHEQLYIQEPTKRTMVLPTVSAAMVRLHDLDGHRLGVDRDGLTRVISPLWTHDWLVDPEASQEVNLANRRAAVEVSQRWFLNQMQGFQIGYSYTVSQVVREHPERAVCIPSSGVWVVVMPPPEREQPERLDSLYGDDSDDDFDRYDDGDDRQEESYNVAVLDGTGNVDVVEDGPTLLRQAHADTGRPHSIFSKRIPRISRLREDPWNGQVLADGEAAPDHLPEAVSVIGETYLIQLRPGIGVSEGIERAVAAVRALSGDSAALLERILSRV